MRADENTPVPNDPVTVIGVPNEPVNPRLVIDVACAPILVTVPLIVAVVVVIAVAAVVVTVGAPIGHALVVNESVAPVPVSPALFIALAVNVYAVLQVSPTSDCENGDGSVVMTVIVEPAPPELALNVRLVIDVALVPNAVT